MISWFSQFSWSPNWLQGKPSTARVSGNYGKIMRSRSSWCGITFAHNSFICVKSLVVVPHKVAVFSTSTTLPLNSDMETILPSSSLAASNSWKFTIPLLPASDWAASLASLSPQQQ